MKDIIPIARRNLRIPLTGGDMPLPRTSNDPLRIAYTGGDMPLPRTSNDPLRIAYTGGDMPLPLTSSASPLTQYEPYNGMEGHQLGQPMFDKKYHNDALIQELMKALAFDQILGAFTPQIAQGGGQNAFLDTLVGNTGGGEEPAPVTPETPVTTPAPAPVEAAPMAAPEGRNDGYDAPGGFAGPDGYGLYSNHYAGTGMYNAPNESVTGFYSGQNSEGSRGEGGAAGK